MRVFPHWSRARLDLRGDPDPNGAAIAFGWSQESQEAARAHALERAARVAERLRTRNTADLRGAWEYYPTERPLREPEVERIDRDGELAAVVTRNGYGAYVLNAARALFVDVDAPVLERAPPTGFFARLFGATPAPAAPDPMDAIRSALASHPDLGWRWYKTSKGYRGLVISRPFDPAGAEAVGLMGEIGADPLYIQLCKQQQCSRARLSAKPWRVDLQAPQTHFFPWDDDPERERRFRAWDRTYDQHRAGFAVCRPLDPIGPKEVHPDIAPLLELHDRWCCTGESKLA